MGKRGPPKTPTKVLERRGSWRAGERGEEPTPEAGRPDVPYWLVGRALELWDHVVPQLEQMGVLTRIDGYSLARYCDLYAEWRRCRDWVRKRGRAYSIKDREGNKIRRFHPEVKEARDLDVKLTRLEREFGLTPAARVSLHVVAASGVHQRPEETDEERFFGSRGS